MTPVEQVQQWLTAIGETTYDPAHRERLMWEELREVQEAMDEHHLILDSSAKRWPRDGDSYLLAHRKTLINLASELCDLAYVAIGTAVLTRERVIEPLKPFGYSRLNRHHIEADLYRLFIRPDQLSRVARVAAFYGFGDKLAACFAAVHEANMRKVEECDGCEGLGWFWEDSSDQRYGCTCCHGTGRHVRRDPDGRIIKPAGWQSADLGEILFGKQGAIDDLHNEETNQ